MSEHYATLKWRRESADFTYRSYNRDHDWVFSGSQTVRASSAPAYLGNPDLVDPEQAFIAALSSCHMLTFLALATKEKLVVDEYVDEAVGIVEKDSDGNMAVTRVALHPRICFADDAGPDAATLTKLHKTSHKLCFIANSVTTRIEVK